MVGTVFENNLVSETKLVQAQQVYSNRLAVMARRYLAPLALGSSLFFLAGCEGILGGIQDLGQGSGCSFVANILPVCGDEAGISPSEQSQPKKPPVEVIEGTPVVELQKPVIFVDQSA